VHQKAEAKFAKQIAKGIPFWRQQRTIAFAACVLLVIGAVYQLYRTWQDPSPDPFLDLFRILTLVGFALAAAIWQVHAELMLGAAQAAASAAAGPPVKQP
jgi:hypothetical protein